MLGLIHTVHAEQAILDKGHYAKKSLELNLKTFLKPSDVKTCLEKALESFQQVYLNFI